MSVHIRDIKLNFCETIKTQDEKQWLHCQPLFFILFLPACGYHLKYFLMNKQHPCHLYT